MAKNIENKEIITFEEFRAWLTGLIRGKRGSLPDIEDWKQIKIMMDKVEEGKKYQDFPLQPTYHPPLFVDPAPAHPWYNPYPIWCTTESTDFNFGDLDIEIPELKEPNIGMIDNITLTGTPQTREEFEQNVKEFEEVMNEMLKYQEEKNGS